jgi:2,3-bisphosphoglycerate-independent phosphoglycerate mutase
VPLVVTREGLALRDGGELSELAPTILELLRVVQPGMMTARSLLVDNR